MHIRIILSEVKGYSEKFRKIYLEHLRGSLFFNKSAGCWARTSLLCNIARWLFLADILLKNYSEFF